jgi:multidrug resistance efflux pump
VVIAAAIAVALIFDSQSSTQTAVVDRGPVGERVVARGEVTSSHDPRHIYPQQDGRILNFSVREGDRVSAGQALVELDRGNTHETVRAPEQGVVIARHGAVGDFVRAAERSEGSTPLFAIADPAATELRVEVEAPDASRIEVGQKVIAQPLGAKAERLAAHVTRIGARLQARQIGATDARVRADGLIRLASVAWDAAAPPLPLGTQVDVTIEVSVHEDVTRLPRAAITVRDGQTIAMLPGLLMAQRMPIEVVHVDAAFAEIRGLAQGTRVILPH